MYNHTFFYILDKISFKNGKSIKIADGIKLKKEIIMKIKEKLFNKYKNEFNEKDNTYSICIIFLIKILISFKNLEEIFKDDKIIEENFNLKGTLSSTFNLLCHDCFEINKKFSNLNPLISEGKYNNKLYNNFKNFISKDYKDKKDNIDIKNFINYLLDYANDMKPFIPPTFNSQNNIIMFAFENQSDIEIKLDDSENSTFSSESSKIRTLSTPKIFEKRIKGNKKYNFNIISENYDKKQKDNFEKEKNLFYFEKL